MDFEDKTLTCKDCGKDFVWTAGEQKFYQQKGFSNSPTRCQDCRSKRKEEKRSNDKQYEIICKNCGKAGTVPFQPRDPQNVLCSDCFMAERKTRVAE
jgi:CxxC-x17-CxxC domain-containing protein